MSDPTATDVPLRQPTTAVVGPASAPEAASGLDDVLLEAQAQAVTESPLPVLLVSRTGLVLAVSQGLSGLLGPRREDPVGRPVEQVLVAIGSERERVALRLALLEGEVGSRSRYWQGRLARAAGPEIRVRLQVRNVGIAPSSAVWCALEPLPERSPAAAADDGATTGVSPVPGATTMAEKVRPSSAPEETLSRVVESLGVDAGPGAELVEGVLLMAAVRSGSVSVESRRCRLRDAVLAAVSARADLAVKHRIGVEIDLDAALSATADPVLLHKCVDQIIGNAMRFTSPYGTVVCAGRQEGDRVVLSVRSPVLRVDETLVGRPSHAWFHGASVFADLQDGVGLGLVNARGLAGLMGGEVTLRFESGPGPVPPGSPGEESALAPRVCCDLSLPGA